MFEVDMEKYFLWRISEKKNIILFQIIILNCLNT